MNKLFSLLLLTCIYSASAQNFDKAKLDSYLEALNANDKAMFSLAIIKSGEPIFQRSIGLSDVKLEQKANKETQYRIGSITKVFTATMIFQLIEEKKLSLNTKLAEFYPEVKNAKKISISMLLNHRSGIQNFTNTPEYKKYMTQPKTKAEMVSLIANLKSDFKPDSKAQYSNSGYVLLGFILEDITKDSFAKQLQKRISNKLGLKRTAYGGPIDTSNNQAKSYVRNATQWSESNVTDMSLPHGAGAIISTPTEVGIFLSSLLAGELISVESVAKMKDINQGFGRGLFQFPFYDRRAYGHNGGIDGFRSRAGYFESDDVTFSLTSNGMNHSMNDISIAILSIYFGMPYDIPNFEKKPITLSKQELSKYEGVFVSQQMPLKITLKVKEGQLTAQATGQSALGLTPYSGSDFRFDPAGIIMLFESTGDKVDHSIFELNQGGKKFKFTRE